MPSDSEQKIAVAVSAQAEPPKIYIPACGALCDIFWWARRNASATPPPITASASSKPETP